MSKKIKFVEIQVAKIDREKYAVIPLKEYQAFVRTKLLKKAHQRPRPSFIDERPEVAAFFTERREAKNADTVIEECRQRFGSDNTPSRSALYRFWQKLRSKEVLQEALERDTRQFIELATQTAMRENDDA